MMKTRLFSILVLVLIALGVTPIGNAFAATRNVHQNNRGLMLAGLRHSASPQDSLHFNLTLQGNIDQGTTFAYQAELLVVPTISRGTSSHPFDVCLDVGSQGKPVTDPEVGDITLDSNSGCNTSFSTATDMGSLTYDQSTGIATFQVDPGASALGVNIFATGSGITGGFEYVVQGTMVLQFSHNGSTNYVNGKINVGGNESAYAPTQDDIYTATVSGSTN